VEYVATFLRLVICLLLGGLMHAVLRSSFGYKLISILAAPGIVVRKLAMTTAAMLCGATLTELNLYRVSERDVTFSSEGAASLAKVLVPVVPIFACALALQAINAALGQPVPLSMPAPQIATLDAGGFQGFLAGLGRLLMQIVRETAAADWGSAAMYVLLAFVFSFSLGATVPFEKFKESLAGVTVLVVGLAVVCRLVGVPTGTVARLTGAGISPVVVWFASVRDFLIDTSSMAAVMMAFGLLAAVAVGIAVRGYEMVSKTSGQPSGIASRRRHGRKAA